jgi:lambda family phage portal protein
MAKRRRPRAALAAAAAASSTAVAMASTQHAAAAYDDLSMGGWNPAAGSADADLLPELETLLARSRDMARNNGLAAGATQTLKDNIIGAILRLSAKPDWRLLGWTPERAREWSNLTEAKFRTWADTTECDASREQTLHGLTLQALGGTLLNGDALALPLWLPRPGASWSTRLLMVEADRLRTPIGLQMRDDIRGGIERDRYGAPVAYYLTKRHPGDSWSMGIDPEYERIPAFTAWGRRRVLHLHDKERAGQSRGKPIVTAVMREFHMAGKYANTELQAAVSNSLIAAFLESDLSPEASANLFGDDPRAAWGQSLHQARNMRELKGAAVIPLPVGARLSSFTPGRPNPSFEAFMLATLRHIAAGLNIPYELLVKDFSKTNYSSVRAALLEAWRYFNGRRRWLMDVWLRPIYELWLEEAINAGEIEAPGFYQNRHAYTRCRFIFGGKGWVDPVKEAQASVIRRNAHMSTLEAECAEQGLDYEEVIEQIAAEQALMRRAGIEIAPMTAARPSGGARTGFGVPGNGRGEDNADADEDEDA